MLRRILVSISILFLATRTFADTPASAPTDAAPKLLKSVTPSLVAVQVTWEYEFGKVEYVGPGVVVSDDGLIMMTLGVVNPSIPDSQLSEFKIIVPREDVELLIWKRWGLKPNKQSVF